MTREDRVIRSVAVVTLATAAVGVWAWGWAWLGGVLLGAIIACVVLAVIEMVVR